MALTDDGGSAADLLGGGASSEDQGGGGGQGGGGSGGDDAGFGEGGGGDEPDFFQKLSTEGGDADNPSNRDWIKAKGFKDIDGIVKSYREAEKTIRSGGRIAVPGADAKPEDIAAFRTGIGVPEKADGYEIKAPEGVQLNEPLIARLREAAHKAGTPKAAFEGIVTDYIQAQMDEQHAETVRQDDLAKDWVAKQGDKKDEALAHVTTALRTLGLSSADGQALRNALGADRALTLMAKIGSGMSEDTMLGGGKTTFGVSAAEAQAEIARLKADPEFGKKAMTKGTPEEARWNRLNAAAAQKQQSDNSF